MVKNRGDFIPALKYDRLTSQYDPLLRWTLRDSTFKCQLVKQAGIERGHQVLDLGWAVEKDSYASLGFKRIDNLKTACTIEVGLNQMKRFGVIVLSVLVLYAGVAWALEKCWDREGHSDHPASGTHHDSSSSLGHPGPSDESLPLNHCLSLINRIGPATTTATTTLSRPIEGTYLDHSHTIPPISVQLSGSGLLISLIRNLTFSFHAGIPHHLYLSVLHI